MTWLCGGMGEGEEAKRGGDALLSLPTLDQLSSAQLLMSYNGDKRRRVDDFSLYVAPSTSRTAAKARNDRAAQEAAARQAATRPKDHDVTAPLVG